MSHRNQTWPRLLVRRSARRDQNAPRRAPIARTTRLRSLVTTSTDRPRRARTARGTSTDCSSTSTDCSWHQHPLLLDEHGLLVHEHRLLVPRAPIARTTSTDCSSTSTDCSSTSTDCSSTSTDCSSTSTDCSSTSTDCSSTSTDCSSTSTRRPPRRGSRTVLHSVTWRKCSGLATGRVKVDEASTTTPRPHDTSRFKRRKPQLETASLDRRCSTGGTWGVVR